MDKRERNFVFFLLLIILILSCFLVYKIKSEPKYDEKLYNEIYAEYEELFETNQEELKEDNNLNNNKKDNTIYLRVDSQGNEYRVAGKITIPKISIQYPIIYETSEDYVGLITASEYFKTFKDGKSFLSNSNYSYTITP